MISTFIVCPIICLKLTQFSEFEPAFSQKINWNCSAIIFCEDLQNFNFLSANYKFLQSFFLPFCQHSGVKRFKSERIPQTQTQYFWHKIESQRASHSVHVIKFIQVRNIIFAENTLGLFWYCFSPSSSQINKSSLVIFGWLLSNCKTFYNNFCVLLCYANA